MNLKENIYSCACDRCSAVRYLVDECGAVLVFSPGRAGRLCELAVVAAAGSGGIDQELVVVARRKYAKHLNVTLKGPISDSNSPVHIKHAVTNSNHNSNARNRINLGKAVADFKDGYFFLA